jgi:predicted PurR-regulated permease PerM
VATQSPYRWLRVKFRSPNLTATVAVILVLLLIIGPAIFLGTYLVQNAIQSINEIRTADASWRTMVESQPALANLLHWAEANLDLETHITRAAEGIASHATGFLKGSASLVTQLGISLFVLFFMYRDCSSGLDALYRLVPLTRSEAHRMFDHVAQTLRATVNGSLTVVAVQALMAGMMYASPR